VPLDVKALLSTGWVTAEDIEHALRLRAREGGSLLGQVLRASHLDEEELCDALAAVLDVRRARHDALESVAPETAALVPDELCHHTHAVPLRLEEDGTLVVATSDPTDDAALAELEYHTGRAIQAELATPMEVQFALERQKAGRATAATEDEEQFLYSGDDELLELFAAACADESEIIELVDLDVEMIEEPPPLPATVQRSAAH
jgi:hypothetical protein